MTIRITIITVLAAVAISCSSKPAASTGALRASEIVPDIAVQKVTLGSVSDRYEAAGTVRATTTTQVAANIQGQIVRFPAAEGDRVTKGQLLAEIDGREAKARLDKAQAALKEAEASIVEIDRSAEAANASVKTAETNKHLAEVTFGRYRELYERKSVSAQEFDEVRSRLAGAASELERARANVQTISSRKLQINARIQQARADIAGSRVGMSYSRITSPVSGVIVKKFAEQGAMASPGTTLLSIEDNSQYQLEVAVEESHATQVSIGDRVNVTISALGQGESYGRVAEVLPSADAASRSVTVKIDLPAASGLRSGLYGTASFALPSKHGLMVPHATIVQRGQLTGVYVVGGDGTATLRIITTGTESEGLVEVLSGLNDGEDIVAAGIERVKEGARVR